MWGVIGVGLFVKLFVCLFVCKGIQGFIQHTMVEIKGCIRLNGELMDGFGD